MAGIKFGFKMIGAEALAKKLSNTNNVKSPLSEGIRKITLWLDGMVKQSTPVDTGRLRSGVTSQISPDLGIVGNRVEYASFVEYGTKRMEARHVTPGLSTRVKGKGPFTYAMEKLQEKMGEFLKDIANAIEVRFG